MEQQLQELKLREVTTKAMYEKILLAINSQDKSEYQFDIEKVQELLQQFCTNTSSYKSEQLNLASLENLQRDTKDQLEQINNYKEQIQNMSQQILKLNKQLETSEYEKEKQNEQIDILKKEITTLSEQICKQSQQFLTDKEQLQSHFKTKELKMIEKHEQDIKKIKEDQKSREMNENLEGKVRELELVITKSNRSDQILALEKTYQQENFELKQIIQKMKIEKEKDEEKYTKEKESLLHQNQLQEQVIARSKKQMNNNLSNNNDATKRLKQKLTELEKDNASKCEEIQRLKNKAQIYKTQLNKFENLEKKQGVIAYNQLGNSKERHQLQKSTQFKDPINSSLQDSSLFVDVSSLQKSQSKIQMKIPNRITSKAKHINDLTTKSNGTSQKVSDSQASTQNNGCFSDSERSATPNNNFLSCKTEEQRQQEQQKQTDQQSKQAQQNTIYKLSSKNKTRKDLLQDLNENSNTVLYSTKVATNQNKNQVYSKYRDMDPQSDNYVKISPYKDDAGEQQLQYVASTNEIEQIVRKMLEQVKMEKYQNQNKVLTPSSTINNGYQNVTFSSKRNNQADYNSKSQNQLVIDKEFIGMLEESLKKLARSNEKIKQVLKEKDHIEKQCYKLKRKVQALKLERNNIREDRDNLVVQNQKIECKLKQAQVILNIDNHEQNANNTSVYNVSQSNNMRSQVHSNSKQNIPIQHFNQLNMYAMNDASSKERFKNPPMSCRVNESYDKLARFNQQLHMTTSIKKQQFQNTLDKQSLDQSLITTKKNCEEQQFKKFVPINNYPNFLQKSICPRGKTPTLQINLTQNQINNLNNTNNHTHTMATNNQSSYGSSDRDEHSQPSSVMTSRNFSKSTTNLLQKKQFQQYQQNMKIDPKEKIIQGSQMVRYASNRDDNVLYKSPPKVMQQAQSQAVFNNMFGGGFSKRERSPQLVSNTQKMTILKRMHSNKGKDRYYSRRHVENQVVSDIACAMLEDEDDYEHIANQTDGTLNIQYPFQIKREDTDWLNEGEDVIQTEMDLKRKYARQLQEYDVYQFGEKCIVPSDENMIEESIQLKQVNNSSFAPSLHSRYINDDSISM